MRQTQKSAAEDLVQAHGKLFADLRELDKALAASSAAEPSMLRQRLEAARLHLAEHFRLEEQNGYMGDVGQREPRLERTIQRLAGEHSQLLQLLDALIGAAAATAGQENALPEAVHRWVKRVRQHEIRENNVIQDAFDLDLGAED